MSAREPSDTASAGKRRYLMVTALVLALDQLSKYWAAKELGDGREIDVIPGFFKFSYTENPGIAFGMLNSGNVKWLLVAISVVAITVVIFYLMRTPASNKMLLWSLALLAAGISGNLIDRFRMGRVIDFILLYYRDYQWPVFNVADTAITIGAAFMAIDLFLSPDSGQATASPPAESSLNEPAVEGKNDT
ncbi:MAG TPA: signal peptidase II [Blastocatellia bacterium]|nr:signal peptidase II [Blastocatellia bacterium]